MTGAGRLGVRTALCQRTRRRDYGLRRGEAHSGLVRVHVRCVHRGMGVRHDPVCLRGCLPNLASAAGSTGGVAGRLPSRRGLSPAPRSLRHHPSTAAPASRTQGVHLRCPMYSWNMSVGPSLAVSEARQQLASIIDADDLDEILQLAEDMTDIRAAEAARAEMRTTGETPIPWEQVKADLGLT